MLAQVSLHPKQNYGRNDNDNDNDAGHGTWNASRDASCEAKTH